MTAELVPNDDAGLSGDDSKSARNSPQCLFDTVFCDIYNRKSVALFFFDAFLLCWCGGCPLMNQAELQAYRERLLSLRARLRKDVTQLAESALKKNRSQANGDLSSMPIHMADIGSDNFDQEFTLTLMENDSTTLQKIEDSLHRIEEGTYGICEECGVKIPKARLNVLPYATHCVKCAERLEQ